MKIKELFESRKDKSGNVYDFHWQEEPMGFYVTINNKPVENGFFAAKSYFDRSGAQQQAEKLMHKLAVDAINKTDKEEYNRDQFEKPLSNLEKEWVEMQNRFMSLNEKELARWEKLHQSGVIRKSILDGTHPSLNKR